MRIPVALACTLAMAQPALASDKQDFADCDGRIHPGKQDDGMRGEASTSRYGGLPGSINGIDLAALGIELPVGPKIGACTRALASERLKPTQTLRKAHLLRARAAAHLSAGKPELALADLDLADAAVAGLRDERFYRRSMGASMLLLRALVKVEQDDLAGASELARAALEARPWSIRLQAAAARIIQAGRPLNTASPSPWENVVKLNPQALAAAIDAEAEVGNHAEVLRLGGLTKVEWPADAKAAPPLPGLRDLLAGPVFTALNTSYHLANAKAASGDIAGAKSDLVAIRAKLDELRPPAPPAAPAPAAPPAAPAGEGTAAAAPPPPVQAPREDFARLYASQRERQIEARIALAEGRQADLRKLVEAGPLPLDATTVMLLDAVKAAPPPPVPFTAGGAKAALKPAGVKPGGAKPAAPPPPVVVVPAAPPVAPPPEAKPLRETFAATRKRGLRALSSQVLIAPETPRAVIDYAKSRPNLLGALVNGAVTMGFGLLGGIDRTDGFRSTPNPDGTVKVEYTGNTPSEPMVQEMTLLRAAEVARAQGKWGFEIVNRADYTRYMVTTQYGAEISRVPSGHKTELTIRMLDQPSEPSRGLDAVAVIDALGPFYYSEKAKK
jgi:hypothetical protein